MNNEYAEEELREEPPPKVIIDKIQRNILSDKPRVTRLPIAWDDTPAEEGDNPIQEKGEESSEVGVELNEAKAAY